MLVTKESNSKIHDYNTAYFTVKEPTLIKYEEEILQPSP